MLKVKEKAIALAYKLLFLFILCVCTSTILFAMEDIEEEEHPRSLLVLQEEEGSSSTSHKVSFNKNLKHPVRKALDRLLDEVLNHDENSYLLAQEKTAFRSAVLIYTLPKETDTTVWDDHSLFLEDLDERLFLNSPSKKTIALQIVGALEGPLGAIGAATLVPYLAENLLTFLPVGGSASLGLFISVCICAGIPAARQLYERVGKIAGWFFDDPVLTPSKNDKKPHILKLEKECWKCSFSIPKWGTLFSLFNATVRCLPIGFLFWDGWSDFTTARNVFIGPLSFLYFEKAFSESQEVVSAIANKRATGEIHMMGQKKCILAERVRETMSRLNANQSDKLVNKFYELVQQRLAQLKKNKRNSDSKKKKTDVSSLLFDEEEVDAPEEIISIASLFFLRRNTSALYEEAEESVKKVTHRHIQKKKEDREFVEFSEAASTLVQSSPQKMVNLIGDIDNISQKTNARSFLENLAVYFQGASATGRFIVIQWATSAILVYWGADLMPAFWSGIGVGTTDWVCRAVSEWMVQEETFLSVRHFFSRNTDFWPFRWITTAASTFTSFFFSLPPIAIIFKVLGDTVPTYIKVLLAIATAPSEFSSFFKFFTEKYGNIITGTVTLGMPSTKPSSGWFETKRKRAWLNMKAKQILKHIAELDQETTQQWYYLTQEGL